MRVLLQVCKLIGVGPSVDYGKLWKALLVVVEWRTRKQKHACLLHVPSTMVCNEQQARSERDVQGHDSTIPGDILIIHSYTS